MFCKKEQRDFDDSEFYSDRRWGLVHNVIGDLHTVNGTPVDDDGPGRIDVANVPAAPPPSGLN